MSTMFDHVAVYMRFEDATRGFAEQIRSAAIIIC